jgi:hypothetical protein
VATRFSIYNTGTGAGAGAEKYYNKALHFILYLQKSALSMINVNNKIGLLYIAGLSGLKEMSRKPKNG